MADLILIRGAEVFTPEARGVLDVLIAGNRVAALGKDLDSPPSDWPCEVIDAHGLRLTPGLIDAHTHMSGGGGEAGAATKVPAPVLTSFTTAGVTTAIGLLGTDGTTRSIAELLAAARGLAELGLNALCYTGSYDVPPPTLTGSVRGDIVHVDRIVAVGELAISDHRSSQPTFDEIVKIAAQAHTAGMMTGKAGLVHFHLGDGQRGLSLIREALKKTELPARTFHPTHVNRNPSLWKEAKEMVHSGISIDITAFPDEPNEPSTATFIADYLDAKLPIDKLTMSSDGGGCLPCFNQCGELLRMDVGRSETLVHALRQITEDGYPLEQTLKLCTENPAKLFRFHGRGTIEVGGYADLVLFDSNFNVEATLCEGRWMVKNAKPVVQGLFEAPLDE